MGQVFFLYGLAFGPQLANYSLPINLVPHAHSIGEQIEATHRLRPGLFLLAAQ
jgi:hypothetical protein